ncbi:glycoside hydrolase family 43 protein [Mucilaginibacter rubeus]|uniref:Family 43 glycosylhydrolase n=1 Tax=Mucilaginibacter rubeus TaxID=2027860 RepID=A0A5C1HX96_9SPHI|nr:glycoside hydrolase family 43 protein [Mucilaginibacter rubeus]QEM10173.1 family 43 glycosylhydrolase [Mucilaginibacter rubeus]
MKLLTLRFFAFLLLWTTINQCTAQTTTAVIPGDFPDPTVIATPNGYYAAGTSSEWAPHFPVYHSTDLKTWKQVGYVFDKAPEWTVGSFWAPEYYHINKTYYIYYTARRKSDNVSCIGVATSNYPDHGFTDRGIIVDHGKEAIDPFIYNDNGQLYISFKAYGLDNRPIELLACKLSADGLKTEGEMFSLLKDDKRIGMEGQSILKNGKYYYLFYSAGGCCGVRCSYHVKVARATSFSGPYDKYDGEELLKPAAGWKCSGHGTFVKSTTGQYFYLCHAYNERSEVFTGREGVLATLSWPKNNGWPIMKAVATPRQLPGIHDTFTTNKPALYWQYDFHNASPVVKQGNGKFNLSGQVSEKNKAGIVYGVRPVSDHFDMTTTVSNSNNALKGLAFYGTVNSALGIGTSGKQVKLWMIKDGSFTVIDSVTIASDAPVRLKFSMAPDRTCKAYYAAPNQDWKEISAGKSIPVDFLPQWDRPQRIGLFFKGEPTESAQFSTFDIVNK